jgi:hypothetical protein
VQRVSESGRIFRATCYRLNLNFVEESRRRFLECGGFGQQAGAAQGGGKPPHSKGRTGLRCAAYF